MAYVGRGSAAELLTENPTIDLPNFQTISLQKAGFLVYLTTSISNVLGNSSTPYPILFDTTSFDNGGNVTLNSAGHTIFTAPYSGVYNFECGFRFTHIPVSGAVDGISYIIAAGSTYAASMGDIVTNDNISNELGWLNSVVLQLNASDVVYVAASANGAGSSSIGIKGIQSTAVTTYFSGAFLT